MITGNSIILTGGIGDVLTIDSYLTDEDRAKIKKIYWATKTQKFSRRLINAAKRFFPNLKRHVVAWNQFELFHGFGQANWLHKLTQDIPPGYDKAQDLSISLLFKKILNKEIPFQGSCLLRDKIADIESFKLPKKYLCIVPHTDNGDGLRNFTLQEWANVLKWLIHTNQIGVGLGTNFEAPYEANCFINLIGKTTPEQSIEVLKHSYGYIGIDTWLSVLAAQLFEPYRLMIKSKNVHLFINKAAYYAPHTNFEFVSKNILPMMADPLLMGLPSIPVGDNLNWVYLHDICYHSDPLHFMIYDQSYFEKYKQYETNDLSSKLNSFRVKLVNKYCKKAPVLDFGIGSGTFISKRNCKTYGFDICNTAVDWLKKKKLYVNPWIDMKKNIAGYCFWDSFEHIAHPSLLMASMAIDTHVFISMPIVPNEFMMCDLNMIANNLSQWKHFRPNEHLHYWTSDGIKIYMKKLGFFLLEESSYETKIGRQDIKTFVFVKKGTQS